MKATWLVPLFIVIVCSSLLWFIGSDGQQTNASLRERGVLFYNTDIAQPGLTLYNSRYSTTVQLVSMTGEVVRSWDLEDSSGWGIHNAFLDSAGNLLAIFQVQSLVKMSPGGAELWRATMNPHHDLVELENGKILSFDLSRTATLQHRGKAVPIYVDTLVDISPDGVVSNSRPLLKLLRPHLTEKRIDAALKEIGEAKWSDIFHCNGLDVASRDIPPHVKKGDILISCRDLNLLLITDPDCTVERWSFGPGILDGQHDPSFLPNGDILLLDNRPALKRSRVITININQKVINSEYAGEGMPEFFTKTMGGVQYLENGNLLISLGRSGEMLELTSDRRLAWLFKIPDRTPDTRLEPWMFFSGTRYPLGILSDS